MKRHYRYIGPADLLAHARSGAGGTTISSIADLAAWLRTPSAEADGSEWAATFVVTLGGDLRIASRRSEHVSCASGADVLAAGEIFFSDDRPNSVVRITNQSTGYCPEPSCWPAVSAALQRAGVQAPTDFTTAFTFRRCPSCGERNLIKENNFTCAICDADLPASWNF
jgi:hypothetical protein